MEGLGVVIPEPAREELRDQIYTAMLDAEGSLIGQYDFTMMANDLTRLLRTYHIQVPINLMLMLKVIIMVLDVGVTLDPKFNFIENSDRFMDKLSAKSSVLEQIFKRGGRCSRGSCRRIVRYAEEPKQDAQVPLHGDD